LPGENSRGPKRRSPWTLDPLSDCQSAIFFTLLRQPFARRACSSPGQGTDRNAPFTLSPFRPREFATRLLQDAREFATNLGPLGDPVTVRGCPGTCKTGVASCSNEFRLRENSAPLRSHAAGAKLSGEANVSNMRPPHENSSWDNLQYLIRSSAQFFHRISEELLRILRPARWTFLPPPMQAVAGSVKTAGFCRPKRE
jgi:hypothetical protein